MSGFPQISHIVAPIHWEPISIPEEFSKVFPDGLLDLTVSGEALIAGGSVMTLGRFLALGGALSASEFLKVDHIADVDVFLMGWRAVEQAKAYVLAETSESIIFHDQATPLGTVMASTKDTRDAISATAAIQFVFGSFGCSQEQVLQSFDMDVVTAGLRKTASGTIELGTAKSTKTGWSTGIATVLNGKIIHPVRFSKLYEKGILGVRFASPDVEADAKNNIAGPEDLSHGKFSPGSVVLLPSALVWSSSKETAMEMLKKLREDNAGARAKALAKRDAYFERIVTGKEREAPIRLALGDVDYAYSPREKLQVFEDVWDTAIARGVLTASYRKSGVDTFYGHTYVSSLDSDSEHVRKFLETTGTDQGPVLDVTLRVFRKVLEDDKADAAARAHASKRARAE
jgi:hypothetical protein